MHTVVNRCPTGTSPSLPPGRTRLRRLCQALVAASLLTLPPLMAQTVPALPAQALPSGLQVVSGQAQVQTQGAAMTVHNSANAILNWSRFNIGAQASVRFQQPDAASQVLNRVTGADPSQILGQLSSNGRVWLLNPNGVIFGSTARVDVAGLVASTLRLNDSDFLAGRFQFGTSGENAGALVQQGEIRTALGGHVALLGGSVRQEGLIDAPGGRIVLAAGESVALVDTATPNVAVKLQAPGGEVAQLGTLRAAGGRIDVHAAAVNVQGLVQANALQTGAGGEILIQARQGVDVGPSARVTADGSQGGQVRLDAGTGRLSLHGQLSARGDADVGGGLVLLGREIGLMDGAVADVSGATGGGSMRIGGGLQGRDPSLTNAHALYMGPQASLRADALSKGQGGSIILWSDRATRAFGAFSARGGAQGGDGGFVETSGGFLDARPIRVDLSAPRGQSGQWLLDPYNITIVNGTGLSNTAPDFTATGPTATIGVGTIEAALNAGTNVVVSTGGAGGNEAGDITLGFSFLTVTAANPGSLTLIADRDISGTEVLLSSSGPMNIALLAGRGGSGAIQLNTASIDSGGGSITMGGFGSGAQAFGGTFSNALISTSEPWAIELADVTLNAGNGDIVLRGVGDLSSGGKGVYVRSSSQLSGRNITLQGFASEGTGVDIRNSTLAATGQLTVQGVGGSFGSGVALATAQLSAGSGALTVQGQNSGTGNGVFFRELDSVATLRTVNGTPIVVRASNVNDGMLSSPALNAETSYLFGNLIADTDTGGGAIALTADPGSGGIQFDEAGVRAGSAGLSIRGPSVNLFDSSVTATGRIGVWTNDFRATGPTFVSSTASGDAIVLAGDSQPQMLRFRNQSSSSLLQVTNGRWITFATNVTDAANWQPGSLAHDFKRYSATFGRWSSDAGNGLVFSAPQTALVSGSAQSRVYDGTTNIVAAIGGVSGVNGDVGFLRSGVTVSLADKNVGTGKPLSFSVNDPFDFLDQAGRPVYGYIIDTSSLGATVTPRPLTISGLTALDRVYDGTAVATLGGTVSLANRVPGDDVGLATGLTGTFANKNVGIAKPVTVGALALAGADAGNYVLLPGGTTGLTATIRPRPISITGLTVADKVYDATTSATLAGGSISAAVLPGDNVSIAGSVVARFFDKNVGTGKAVEVTGLTLSGPDAPNYVVDGAVRATGNILPLERVLSGLSVLDKVYDGTTVATFAAPPVFTPLPGDSAALVGPLTGTFADRNVGTGKAVTVGPVTLAGADAGNYRVVVQGPLTASISPLLLTLPATLTTTRVYDGTTAVTFTAPPGLQPLAGDQVTLPSLTGRLPDKSVGVNRPVTLNPAALAGPDAGNYRLELPTGALATIEPRPLPVAGLVAQSRVYDATTVATLSGAPAVTPLPGDVVTVAGSAVGRFADKNVGTGKPVAVEGLSLGGADAANYKVLATEGLTANITPRPLSASGITVAPKVYDGTVRATLDGVATLAVLAGDQVSLSGSLSASFADRNVGAGKPVTVTGFGLAGPDAANYRLDGLGALMGTITARPVSVQGLTVASKVYDGTAVATLSGSPSLNTLAGDQVSLSGIAQAAFPDKNVGANRPVTLSGLSLQGADAGNYSLLPPAGLQASITPRPLAVAGLVATSRTYDGTDIAPLAGSAAIAPLAGDSVNVAGSAVGRFPDRNAGQNKPVLITGLSLAGVDAPNYTLTLPSLQASITPAPLLYVAAPLQRLLGQPIGPVTGTVSGLVGGDTLATATSGTLVFSTPAVDGAPEGLYPIVGGGLSALNYTLAQAPGNATALAIVRLGPQLANDSGATQAVAAVAPAAPPVPAPALLPTAPGLAPPPSGLLDLVFGSAPPPPAPPTLSPSAPAPTPAPSPSPSPAPAPSSGAGSGASASAAAVSGTGSAGGTSAAAFSPVRLSTLSARDLQALLDSRDRYKKAVFAEAIAQLEQSPGLADMRPCTSLREAQAGTCLVTEAIKAQFAAAPAPAPAPVVAAVPVPVPGPAAVSPAAPAPAPSAPPSAAPAATPAVAAAPEAAALSAFETALSALAERRRVRSAALPQIERKVALVIGVDRYNDPAIPTLANAVRDARAIGRIFESELGYETVVLENANRAAVVGALNRLALELRPQDSVVVYYAGHGELVQSTQLGYWQLTDADAKRPETWLSNADISRLIGRIGASQVALISDSCYSGSLVAEERLRASTAPVDPVAVLTRKSVVVMTSGGNEPVFDEGKQGHSPFAWNLMANLRQVPNWRPGGQIFERVRFAVARELPQRPQYGVSSVAGHQPGGDYLFELRQLDLPR